MSWNIQGYHAHIGLLLAYLDTHKPAIICLQETRTKKEPKIPGYILYHIPANCHKNTDPDDTTLGTVIAIRQDVPHDPTKTIKTHRNNMEIVSVQITTQENKNITVNNVYTRPKNNTDFQLIPTNNTYTITVGDFNTDTSIWGKTTTIYGEHFLQEVNQTKQIIINQEKTPTTIYGSTLDYALVSPDIYENTKWTQINELTSDHIATLLNLQLNISAESSGDKTKKWKLNKADWQGYKEELRNHDPQTTDNSTLQEKINEIQKTITDAANHNIPKKTTNKGKPKEFLTSKPKYGHDC